MVSTFALYINSYLKDKYGEDAEPLFSQSYLLRNYSAVLTNLYSLL